VTVSEGGGTATFEVTLSGGSAQTVTVDYGTANGSAASWSDYVGTSGTLTFAAYETTKPIVVSILEDSRDEGAETFTVTLRDAANAVIARSTATCTITDNDAAPAVSFDYGESSGSESASPASVAVSLTAESGKTVTVQYAVTGGTATGGGVDYALSSGTLTFAPGERSNCSTRPMRRWANRRSIHTR